MLSGSLRVLRGNILVFAVTDLLGNFARNLVFPYASLYILALGGDAADIGLVNSLALFAGLFMLPLAGHVTDRADRVRIIVISGLLSSLFLSVIALAPDWRTVAIASLLLGTIVFQFPAYSSLIADSLAPADRGVGLGMMNMISNSLAILAPFIAGLLIQRYTANTGMRILYTVMLVAYLGGSLIQWRFLRETSAEPRRRLHLSALVGSLGQSYRAVPGLVRQMSVPLLALACVVLLSFMANAINGPYWVVYATDHIGFSAAEWGVILLAESIVRLVAFWPAGLLVDRYGRAHVLFTALAIGAVTIPLFVVLDSFVGILLSRCAAAVAFSLAMPASMALMADLVPRSLRGQMMAAIGQGGLMLVPAMGGVGGPSLGYLFIPLVMISSLAGGFLYTLNPLYPWAFSLLATLLSLLLVYIFVRDPQNAEV